MNRFQSKQKPVAVRTEAAAKQEAVKSAPIELHVSTLSKVGGGITKPVAVAMSAQGPNGTW